MGRSTSEDKLQSHAPQVIHSVSNTQTDEIDEAPAALPRRRTADVDAIQEVFQKILDQQTKMQKELDEMKRSSGTLEMLSMASRSRPSSPQKYLPLPPPRLEPVVNEETFNDPRSGDFEFSREHKRLL